LEDSTPPDPTSQPKLYIHPVGIERVIHYKTRSDVGLSWIKLHCDLRRNPDFTRLPSAVQMTYVWLLMSVASAHRPAPLDYLWVANECTLSRPSYAENHVRMLVSATMITINENPALEYIKSKRESKNKSKSKSTPPPPKGGDAGENGEKHSYLATWLDHFWAAWPKHKRKANKAACGVWYQRNIRSSESHGKLMTALAFDLAGDDFTKEEGQYIPAPLVWLRRNRHKDDIQDMRPEPEAPQRFSTRKVLIDYGDD
jgi:hypothetical protein